MRLPRPPFITLKSFLHPLLMITSMSYLIVQLIIDESQIASHTPTTLQLINTNHAVQTLHWSEVTGYQDNISFFISLFAWEDSVTPRCQDVKELLRMQWIWLVMQKSVCMTGLHLVTIRNVSPRNLGSSMPPSTINTSRHQATANIRNISCINKVQMEPD